MNEPDRMTCPGRIAISPVHFSTGQNVIIVECIEAIKRMGVGRGNKLPDSIGQWIGVVETKPLDPALNRINGVINTDLLKTRVIPIIIKY